MFPCSPDITHFKQFAAPLTQNPSRSIYLKKVANKTRHKRAKRKKSQKVEKNARPTYTKHPPSPTHPNRRPPFVPRARFAQPTHTTVSTCAPPRNDVLHPPPPPILASQPTFRPFLLSLRSSLAPKTAGVHHPIVWKRKARYLRLYLSRLHYSLLSIPSLLPIIYSHLHHTYISCIYLHSRKKNLHPSFLLLFVAVVKKKGYYLSKNRGLVWS